MFKVAKRGRAGSAERSQRETARRLAPSAPPARSLHPPHPPLPPPQQHPRNPRPPAISDPAAVYLQELSQVILKAVCVAPPLQIPPAQQQALDAGVKLAGCSVHFVRACVDEGPIIAQAAVPVLENDDVKTLSARILALEHRLYPLVIQLIAEGGKKVVGERAVINTSYAPVGALSNPSHD